MRWLVLIALAACGGERKPAAVKKDAGLPADAARVTGEADRDRLFLSVPSAKAVEGIIERLSATSHVAATPENEAVGKEIMRTLGRMGWKLGTQQYDVYLPHPKRLAITIRGDDKSRPIVIPTKEGDLDTWNAYSASGTVTGPIGEGTDVKGKIALVPYGDVYRGVQVAAAEKAGAKAVIFYPTDPGRPSNSVQRGTVLAYWQRPGAPRSATDPALPKIPVLNVSAENAAAIRAQKGAIVEVVVEMDDRTRPIRDIIAVLEGKSPQAVILGNHYDAWGPGAIDPLSGTAAMIEIARGLTALTQAGWRPERTIILAFWDGEEPGMLGSTEWVEENVAMLRAQAVAYFNVDSIRAGELLVQGPPTLREHIRACASAVTNPVTKKPFAPVFEDLGIGSDYTAFLHYAGVESLQFASTGTAGTYNVWHSTMDDLEHAKLADPGFAFTPAFASVMGLCAIQLADAAYLPFDYVATADWIAAALAPHGVDLAKQLDRLRTAGERVKSLPTKAGGTPAACNAAMIVADFTNPNGYFSNVVTGADPVTGYRALLVPEIASAKTPAEKARAVARLEAAIRGAADALEPCR